jgi:hypothetical protein
MDNLLFWMGIGAARRKSAGKSRSKFVRSFVFADIGASRRFGLRCQSWDASLIGCFSNRPLKVKRFQTILSARQ